MAHADAGQPDLYFGWLVSAVCWVDVSIKIERHVVVNKKVLRSKKPCSRGLLFKDTFSIFLEAGFSSSSLSSKSACRAPVQREVQLFLCRNLNISSSLVFLGGG